jgi:acyl-CoA reductase-like NAD-dependent aldehyde dehydrogenase
MHPDTFIGPMIDADAADRAMSWIGEAREKGATILTGGQRRGNTILPTLIEDLPDDCALAREEAFAPVAVLQRYDALDDAIALVNRSRFGIHVGIFTHDARTIRAVFDGCEVGGVIVNDVPSWRADAMPYGGVKDSGLGREGPRYAIEEMTERRTLVLHEPRVAARGDRA